METHLVWRCYLTYMTHHRVCLRGFAKCLSWCLPGSEIHTSRGRREHSICLDSLPKPLYHRHGKNCGEDYEQQRRVLPSFWLIWRSPPAFSRLQHSAQREWKSGGYHMVMTVSVTREAYGQLQLKNVWNLEKNTGMVHSCDLFPLSKYSGQQQYGGTINTRLSYVLCCCRFLPPSWES
jgi:hypothetical protein